VKNIGEIIDMSEFFKYIYLEEQKMFKFESSSQYSSVFQIKEMLEIVGILEQKSIRYIIDEHSNIILNNLYA